MAIPKPCLVCGRIVANGKSRCVEHAKQQERRRQARQPYRREYQTPEYRAARQLAMRRDGYRCVHCGSTQQLETHHVVPLADLPPSEYGIRSAAEIAAQLETVCFLHNPRGGRPRR